MLKKIKLDFHIVLLGMVASGKDTQAELLLKKYTLQPVESGKYWRQMLTSKTKDGDLVRKTVGRGMPAPVKLMKKFLLTALAKKPKNKTLLFVGNPRLKPEAQLLKKLLAKKKEKFLALYISLSDKEVYKRSFGRKRGGDDHRAHIKKRIKWHKIQVGKTIRYLKKLGILKTIDGRPTIPQVYKSIQSAIEKF